MMSDDRAPAESARLTTESTHVQSVRVRGELRARIDTLVRLLRERPPGLRVSRSNVLLSIIEAGLKALEDDLLPPTSPQAPDPTVERTVARTRGRRTEERVPEPRKKTA